MALTRLALKNLQQRVLVSSPASAVLFRSYSATDVSDQTSEGNETKLTPKSQAKKNWLWRNDDGEFHIGNSLMQAAENINRVLKSLNMRRPWWGRVKEEEDCYKLRIEMPGIAKEHVKVRVDGRILRIRGEQEEESEDEGGMASARYGCYDAAVMLPEDAVADEIKAEMKDGVLVITVSRSATSAKDVKEVTVV